MDVPFIVIDDHPQFIMYWCAVMPQYGAHCVASAQTGEDGLRLIEKHRPSVVLIDWCLPDMNAFEVMRRCTVETRWVLCSAFSESGIVRKANAMGFTGIISKTSLATEQVQIFKRIAVDGEDDILDTHCMHRFWAALEPLSRTDEEIIKGRIAGETMAQIAARVGLSVRTTTRVSKALDAAHGLGSPVKLICFAKEYGLLDEATEHALHAS